jgi:hypothetical protein
MVPDEVVRARLLHVPPTSLALAGKPCTGALPEFGSSRSVAIVIVQHAAEALPSLDIAYITDVARFWADEVIRQALVIALAMMEDEVLNGCSQRLFAEEDHAIQAGLLDGTNKSLRVRVGGSFTDFTPESKLYSRTLQ